MDNNSSAMDSTIDAEFNKQLFSGLTKSTGATQDNASNESGLTMVKVYKAEADKNGVLQKSTYVPIDSTLTDTTSESYINYKKWSGLTQFDYNDVGYYYLYYYWRLDDGRYLQDIKLVNITEADAYVEMRTGILNTSLEDGKTNLTTNDIDQYVYNNAEGKDSGMTASSGTKWDTNDTIYWYKNYPTQQTTYSKSLYNGDPNGDLEFYGDSEYTYSMKSVRGVTNSASNVVGWYNTDDYKMTTLIIEVLDGGEWKEMVCTDEYTDVYSLDGATYSATFVSYNVSQDPKTRQYTVTESKSDDAVSFSVKTYNSTSTDKTHMVTQTGTGNGGTAEDVDEERYIVLSVTDSSGAAISELQNPIRVTALYRQAEAEITPQKEVLLPDSTEDSKPNSAYTSDNTVTTGTSTYYTESLSKADDDRSMDNDGVTDESARHAVLEGDELTYRVKLKNLGYNEATSVSLSDAIPSGCTYVTGSAKVYKQFVDFSSNVIKYNAVEDATGVTATCNENTINVNFGNVGIDFKYEYYVYFKVKVGSLKASSVKGTVDNTAYLTYTDTKESKTNTDIKSNTVTTDQVHQYFKIQKNITSADVGRSFLYKVERYESEGGPLAETYYVNLSFDDASTTVTKALQVDEEGYYVVSEIDDWSITDYVNYSGTDEEKDTHSFTLKRDNLYTFYTSDINASPTTCENTAKFTNALDSYAYSDSQAYANNKIGKKPN